MDYDIFKGVKANAYRLDDHNTDSYTVTYEIIEPVDGMTMVVESVSGNERVLRFHATDEIKEDFPAKEIDLMKLFNVLEFSKDNIEEID